MSAPPETILYVFAGPYLVTVTFVTDNASYWGPHFPDAGGSSTYWGPHFQEITVFPDIAALGPAGVGSLALVLEDGFTVTYTFDTDVQKFASGKERRIALLDDPQQKYQGSAMLLGPATQQIRAQLAQYAAAGAMFLLAMPHEAMTLTNNASGSSVYVGSTASCDWAMPGRRVILRAGDGTTINAVVQAVFLQEIVIDAPPGAFGAAGNLIMPVMPVVLDAQQQFPRYPTVLESWQITASAAVVSFSVAAIAASLSLAPSVTNSGALDNVTLVARDGGSGGNSIRVRFVDDAITAGGDYTESGLDVTVHVEGNTTTCQQLADVIDNANGLIELIGSFNPTDVVAAGDDVFSYTSLAGGVDELAVEMGVGATVTIYSGRPIYDRPLLAPGTITDSMHSLSEIIDLGGVRSGVGIASSPDWGRQVSIEYQIGAQWQWFKAFISTVRGAQKSFWLPTWRADFPVVSFTTTTITVTASGTDFFAWWPLLRDRLQVVQGSTITYAQITAALNNGDGTLTLTVSTIPSSPAITLCSWLDLCRLESDEIAVAFQSATFATTIQARVVQQ